MFYHALWVPKLQKAYRKVSNNFITPPIVLSVLIAISTALKLIWLNVPGNGFVFDEKYYVNAARVIAHIAPDNSVFSPYTFGIDPNSEHPPLAKVLIAGSIHVFGDNAWGWRIWSVVFGAIGLFAMYWLVSHVSKSLWIGVGATFLMAFDNLMFIHSRSALLDIFVIAMMLLAAAFYVRGYLLIAGAVLGIGACFKLVAFYLVFVIVIYELFKLFQHYVGSAKELDEEGLAITKPKVPWSEKFAQYKAFAKANIVPIVAKFLWFGISCGAVYFVLLFVLDVKFTNFANPVEHTKYMLNYAANLTSPYGPQGIASNPWDWLFNQKSFDYFSVNKTISSAGTVLAKQNTIDFVGAITPLIIFMAIPALFFSAAKAIKERDNFNLFIWAYFLGTFIPFMLLSLLLQRTSYIHYMLIVLPAIYAAVAQLFSTKVVPKVVVWGYYIGVLIAFYQLFPIKTFGG